MLPGIGRLLHRDRVFPFDHKPVEVLVQQHGNRLRHRSDDSSLHVVDFVQNGQSPVLKDRIRIQYEEPGFHKLRRKVKNK